MGERLVHTSHYGTCKVRSGYNHVFCCRYSKDISIQVRFIDYHISHSIMMFADDGICSQFP